MQSIGNTYQMQQADFALDGKITTSKREGMGADFSAILNSFGKTRMDPVPSDSQRYSAYDRRTQVRDNVSHTDVPEKTSLKEDESNNEEDVSLKTEDRSNAGYSDLSDLLENPDENSSVRLEVDERVLGISENGIVLNAEGCLEKTPVSFSKSVSQSDLMQAGNNSYNTSMLPEQSEQGMTLLMQQEVSADAAFENISAEDIARFLKGDFKSLNGSKNDLTKNKLDSMLAELNGSMSKSSDISSLKNLEQSAKELGVIEESIRASLKLDDEMSMLNEKAKLESLTVKKENLKENSLEASVNVLRNTVAMSKEAVTGEGDFKSPVQNLRLVMGASSLEEAVRTSVSKGDGGSFSNQMGSEGSQSQSHGRAMQELMGIDSQKMSKASDFSRIMEKTDLLRLSQNLKENAEAINHKVMQMAAKNIKNIDLTLAPEGLGKMKISIDATGMDEISKISISASERSTRMLLEGSLNALRDLMSEKDIHAEYEVQDYDAEGDNSREQQEFAENSDRRSGEDNESSSKEEEVLFAGDDAVKTGAEDLSVNEVGENINNSQNNNTISYFA